MSSGSLFGRDWEWDTGRVATLVGDTLTYVDTLIKNARLAELIQEELDSGGCVFVLHETERYFVDCDDTFDDQVLVDSARILAILDDEGEMVDLQGEEAGISADYLVVALNASQAEVRFDGICAELSEDGQVSFIED